MQRVHGIQIRNMEVFAVASAIKMSSTKTREVKNIFSEEVTRLHEDYQLLIELLIFQEEMIKTLSATCVRQEKAVIEVNQYFHQFMRQRKEYAENKDIAKASLDDMISSKYSKLSNNKYLNKTFDFYGMSLRL